MISPKALLNLLCLNLLIAGADAYPQVLTQGGVAPMTKIPSEKWIEKIIGDMDKPGQPFVIRETIVAQAGRPDRIQSAGCFELAIGARMQGERGEGVVVGGLCSPANQFTQYWVKKANGERFWSTLNDLKPLH